MRSYWIVFKPTSNYLSFFLKKDFGHCLILTHDEFNWIEIDPRNSFLHLKIPARTLQDNYPLEIAKKYKYPIVKVTLEDHIKIPPAWRFGFGSCVSFVLYSIGLEVNVLTPYKLYKKLLSLSKKEMVKLKIMDISLIGGKFS